MLSSARLSLFSALFTLAPPAFGAGYDTIVVADSCPPAAHAAAAILARAIELPDSAIRSAANLGIPGPGQLVLETAPGSSPQAALLGGVTGKLHYDGYAIVFHDGGALVYGLKPRSLLYAAGDFPHWKAKASGTFIRNPDFAVRAAEYARGGSVAQYVAMTGANVIIGGPAFGSPVTFRDTLPEVYAELSPADRRRLDRQSERIEAQAAEFARQCHDAGVTYFPFLFGSNFRLWSPTLYAAVLKAYPSARGTPSPRSWEQAALCPSDPATWKTIDAYVREFVEKLHGDGLYVTFWDHYGLYCQDPRCRADGLDQFSNELYVCIQHYHDVLASLGKGLVVRTWASGVPHWNRDRWVHAPGYGGPSGSPFSVWGRVIHELPADIVLQTKVYNCDCQPDPPFSPLLGHGQPHPEIAEYQIAGQTTGRFYFPDADLDYLSWTMRRTRELLGPDGGVCVFPGGTEQSNYSLPNDILNSVNLYAWRELSWKSDESVDQIWRDWAVPMYGAKAAPFVIQALRLSEDAIDKAFSPLGFGTDTNSGFPGNIERRETLLKYTNRYYLPAYARYLEPNRENIQRVVDQDGVCLREIDEMIRLLGQAEPYVTRAQANELTTRFDWLKEFAIVNCALNESLWRYRYLRYEASQLTTDAGQLKALAAAYDTVEAHTKRLFRFDPEESFSCYDVPLGELRRRPSLGDPRPLMRALYQASEVYVETEAGPQAVPAAWRRD